MTQRDCCQYCGTELSLGQAFAFYVEAADYEDRVAAPLDYVESLPDYHGEPLRICWECRESIEQNQRELDAEAERQRARSFAVRRFLTIGGVVLLIFGLILAWL